MRGFEIKGGICGMKQRCVLSPRLVCANEPCRIGEQPQKTLAVCHGTMGSIEVMDIILYLGFALAFVACSVAGFERSWRMRSGYTQWRRWSVENANSGEVQREAASPQWARPARVGWYGKYVWFKAYILCNCCNGWSVRVFSMCLWWLQVMNSCFPYLVAITFRNKCSKGQLCVEPNKRSSMPFWISLNGSLALELAWYPAYLLLQTCLPGIIFALTCFVPMSPISMSVLGCWDNFGCFVQCCRPHAICLVCFMEFFPSCLSALANGKMHTLRGVMESKALYTSRCVFGSGPKRHNYNMVANVYSHVFNTSIFLFRSLDEQWPKETEPSRERVQNQGKTASRYADTDDTGSMCFRCCKKLAWWSRRPTFQDSAWMQRCAVVIKRCWTPRCSAQRIAQICKAITSGFPVTRVSELVLSRCEHVLKRFGGSNPLASSTTDTPLTKTNVD